MPSFSNDQIARIASRARALGDPTRVRILQLLARSEHAVGHVASAIGTEQSTVSKHLQVLFNAGLVQRRREASAVIYSVDIPELPALCHFLAQRSLRQVEARRRRMERSRSAKSIRTRIGAHA
jgi:DNA-binding transcriptional ArsR family regulator